MQYIYPTRSQKDNELYQIFFKTVNPSNSFRIRFLVDIFVFFPQ